MAVNSYQPNTQETQTRNSKSKFCPNCGTKLDLGARFCKNCGKTVGQSTTSSPSWREQPTPNNYQSTDDTAKGERATQPNKNKTFDEPISERRTVFEGEIHKCPSCGQVLDSFMTNCPTCGHEFRGARNSTSVREFAAKIEEIEKTRANKGFGIKKLFEDKTAVSETDKTKISLIRSFVIPNTKEDLLEFLVLASSNINLQRYNEFDSISESEQAVSDAWEAKFEQAYEKAKLSFGHTAEFTRIQNLYEKKNTQIKASKKNRKRFWVGMIVFPILLVGLLWGLVFIINSSDDKKIEAENARLEAIVEEVYDAIEAENYVLARAKAASLTFSGPDTSEADNASERWDKTRVELLAVIDAAIKDSTTDTPAASNYTEPENRNEDSEASLPPSDTEIPDDFTYGYEEAKFTRYKSPASENGLGDSRIYFICTLNKTELLEADGTRSILGYVTDEDGNEWLIQLHFVPAVSETSFDSCIGKEVVIRGVYSGFSGTKEMPVVVLDEMLIIEDGTILNGMQKLLDE